MLERILNTHLLGNKVKWWISKWVFQENKAIQIFRKTNISYSLIRRPTYVYQGVRNVRFSRRFAYVLNEWSPTQKMKFLENLASFVFKTPVLRLALLLYYRRTELATNFNEFLLVPLLLMLNKSQTVYLCLLS